MSSAKHGPERLNKIYPYPIFLKLENKKCSVIGGGNVALRKINELLECGAVITVIAESPLEEINVLAREGKVNVNIKSYMSDDIEDSFLVIAATDDEEMNARIASDARKIKALVNIVDKPEICDFYSGAVLKRGPLRIAVSTSGLCPGFAGSIRRKLEDTFGDEYSALVNDIGEIRKYIVSDKKIPKDKKELALSWLLSERFTEIYFCAGKDKAWEELKKNISS